MYQLSYPDWHDKVVYPKEGILPQTLVEEGKFKALLVGLEAGQKIPTHSEGVAMFHFLGGTGWMLVGNRRFEITPGATIIAPAGSSRGIEATARLAFVAARMDP